MKKILLIVLTVGMSIQLSAQQIGSANTVMDKNFLNEVISELQKSSESSQHARIDRAVRQLAKFWLPSDGSAQEFADLCSTYSAKTAEERELIFNRFQDNFELLWGSFNKMNVGLKIPLHVDEGEILAIDRVFGGYSPGAHLGEDFFANKIAFISMLNFPFYSLAEKTELGEKWTRQEWAFARIGDVFNSRTPANLLQNYSQIVTAADAYISDYNIQMDKLTDKKGNQLFKKEMKLISHWGLRDEIKANYADKKGFGKQALIYEVMLRIIRQQIPQNAINNADVQWNPFTNILSLDGQTLASEREPDTRYEHLLKLFHATQAIDAHSPNFPNYIQRKFESEMEIPVEDIESIFVELVSHPVLKDVASIIEKRLGRKLHPWDIWYDGFKTRSSIDIDKLDKLLKEKYPNKDAFAADLPNILMKLGFSADSAASIASKVIVDPSRGAGHAWGAAMKSEKARLRTRIGANGMDYKGYNIAIHEFGHNVEQTISLHNVDYYLLRGVPNTSFTEALAFVFQARDLELLGMEQQDEMTSHLEALDNLWSNFEIMGVSLVDINVWRWMYNNPNATPAELNQAVNRIAIDIWNQYFAPVFGNKDSPILAIYSHMIDYPLYLSAYPIGQLIEFQFGNYIKGKDFAKEVYHAFSQGSIIPQLWMKGAVGAEISPLPAISAAQKAVEALK